MIVPWLRGFLNWKEAPLTWMLVGLNVLFFILTAGLKQEVTNLNKSDLQWAGRNFALMQNKTVPENSNELILIGTQALRNPSFFTNLETLQESGDKIGFEKRRERLLEFHAQLERRPAYIYGLKSHTKEWASWITYQFMHAGLMHLMGNVMMLILFGAALERLTGSLMVMVVYLVGGICGAAFFILLNPINSAPMVGASASLSAVMAFYALFEKRKRVRYFYFLSPSPGFWGEIYLPTLLILPFYFVEDLASYLSTAEEIGSGVAHAAHLGGAAFGITLAITLRQVLRLYPQLERNLYASYSQSHSEAP